jgi:hypothetical protein
MSLTNNNLITTIKNKPLRKINLKKSILFLAGLTLAVVAIVGMFGVSMFGVGGVNVANTGVIVDESVTADSAGALQAKLNLTSVYQPIIQAYPAVSPLDRIVRESKKTMVANSWDIADYKLTSRPFADTVKVKYTTVGAAKTANIEVTNPSMWTADNTAYINTGENATENGIMFIVESVNRTNGTILIRSLRSDAGVVADVPTIAAGRDIIRLGSATTVTAAQTAPYALIPDRQKNFCQRFMIQFEVAQLDKMQNAEIKGVYDMSVIQQDRVFDYKVGLDASYIFGQKGVTANTLGDIVYTMGGMIESLDGDRTFKYGIAGETVGNRTFTDKEMRAISKYVFAANNGSDTRFMFGGSQLIDYMMASQSFAKQMEAGNTKMIAGINFSEFVTPFGILMIKYHPLFDIIGMGYEEKGLVVDLNNVILAQKEKMTSIDLNLRESGQRAVDAKVVEEVQGLLTVHEETHCLIDFNA